MHFKKDSSNVQKRERVPHTVQPVSQLLNGLLQNVLQFQIIQQTLTEDTARVKLSVLIVILSITNVLILLHVE